MKLTTGTAGDVAPGGRAQGGTAPNKLMRLCIQALLCSAAYIIHPEEQGNNPLLRPIRLRGSGEADKIGNLLPSEPRSGVCRPRLLNDRRLRGDRNLQPFNFLLPLLIRRSPAGGNLVEGTPFRLHPHVGIARKHGARDVPSDVHDATWVA